jgi:hypothetical protein
MKTSKFLLIVMLLLLFACKKTDNDLSCDKLNGPVWSVQQLSYGVILKSGKITKGSLVNGFDCNFLKVYDKQGNLLKTYFFDTNRLLYMKWYYIYNEDGQNVGWDSYDEFGDLHQKRFFWYDDQGNEIRENWYLEGKLDSWHKYSYDEKGNLLQDLEHQEVNLNFKTNYKYDKDNNQIEEKRYVLYDDKTSSLVYAYTYKYDDKGNRIVKYNCTSDSIGGSINRYKYDQNGNQLEDRECSCDKFPSSRRVNRYDKYNNLTQTYLIDNTDSIISTSRISFTYEYDKHDNWIKRITYQFKTPVSILERKIMYY